MSSSYLFRSKGLVQLAGYLNPDTLFAFDLDGTLAPIVEDFREVAVSRQVQEILHRLKKLAKVSVITGRSRQDALAILGMEPDLVIGNHGCEWPPEEPGRSWSSAKECLRWRDTLIEKLSSTQGVQIEYKGDSLSIHYRQSNDRGRALARINDAVRELDPAPRIIGGKCVVNVVAQGAQTKGEALAAAMARLGTARAVYFGDDATDEDVFRVEGIDVFGIRIGKHEETAALYHLNEQPEIVQLLHSMAGVMEMLWEKESIWELQ